MGNNYQKLRIGYFKNICKIIFDGYFYKKGFKEFLDDSFDVTYSKSNYYIKFYYYPEDFPEYILMIDIGFFKRVNEAKVEYHSIGLWYSMPDSDESTAYWKWTFKTANELETVLKRIKDFVLVRYVDVLLNNRGELKKLVEKKEHEVTIQRNSEIKNKKIHEAEKLFKLRHYDKAMTIFEEVGILYLSSLNKKMYDICKFKLNRDTTLNS